MSTDPVNVWERVEAGDVSGAMRELRFSADQLPLGDLARIMERTARMAEFDDLADAASALAAHPDDHQARFRFGWFCIERGATYAAIPVLTAALRQVPDSLQVVEELVVALEIEGRHGAAVTVLEECEAELPSYPHRYLLAFNAVMMGDLTRATESFDRLLAAQAGGEPWHDAYERVRHMLDRAALAKPATSLDVQDLRGWHFVVAGGLLGTLSPYGFNDGMNGRYAGLQDTFDYCRYGLRRLQVILDAADHRPRTVSLLPDRSSHILGLAAAQVFDLPAEPFTAERTETVVVAYDLARVSDEIAAQLIERAPGQVVYEHATCWTEPPAVAADVSTLLGQIVTPPWGGQLRSTADGARLERADPDDRPAADVAADIAVAPGTQDQGDDDAPPDSDETLATFASSVRGQWLLAPRWRLLGAGPVRSSRFV